MKAAATLSKQRVTLLVNIWLNHKPDDAVVFPKKLVGKMSTQRIKFNEFEEEENSSENNIRTFQVVYIAALSICLSDCLPVVVSLCLCVFVSLCLCVFVSLCLCVFVSLYLFFVSLCFCVFVSLCPCTFLAI